MPSELGGEIYCTPAAWPKNSLAFDTSASHFVACSRLASVFVPQRVLFSRKRKLFCEVKATITCGLNGPLLDSTHPSTQSSWYPESDEFRVDPNARSTQAVNSDSVKVRAFEAN